MEEPSLTNRELGEVGINLYRSRLSIFEPTLRGLLITCKDLSIITIPILEISIEDAWLFNSNALSNWNIIFPRSKYDCAKYLIVQLSPLKTCAMLFGKVFGNCISHSCQKQTFHMIRSTSNRRTENFPGDVSARSVSQPLQILFCGRTRRSITDSQTVKFISARDSLKFSSRSIFSYSTPEILKTCGAIGVCPRNSQPVAIYRHKGFHACNHSFRQVNASLIRSFQSKLSSHTSWSLCLVLSLVVYSIFQLLQ